MALCDWKIPCTVRVDLVLARFEAWWLDLFCLLSHWQVCDALVKVSYFKKPWQYLCLFFAVFLVCVEYETSFALAFVATSCINTNLLAATIIHHAFIAIFSGIGLVPFSIRLNKDAFFQSQNKCIRSRKPHFVDWLIWLESYSHALVFRCHDWRHGRPTVSFDLILAKFELDKIVVALPISCRF